MLNIKSLDLPFNVLGTPLLVDYYSTFEPSSGIVSFTPHQDSTKLNVKDDPWPQKILKSIVTKEVIIEPEVEIEPVEEIEEVTDIQEVAEVEEVAAIEEEVYIEEVAEVEEVSEPSTDEEIVIPEEVGFFARFFATIAMCCCGCLNCCWNVLKCTCLPKAW